MPRRLHLHYLQQTPEPATPAASAAGAFFLPIDYHKPVGHWEIRNIDARAVRRL